MIEWRAPGEKWMEGSLLVSALVNCLDYGAINQDKNYKTESSDGEKDARCHLGYVDLKFLWENVENSFL